MAEAEGKAAKPKKAPAKLKVLATLLHRGQVLEVGDDVPDDLRPEDVETLKAQGHVG